MERKEWRDWTIPYLVFRHLISNDLATYEGSNYLNDDLIGPPKDGDVAVTPVRAIDNAMEVEEVDVHRVTPFAFACGNQLLHDYGIVYERHNKGIPMLQICDLKLQYGSEDHITFHTLETATSSTNYSQTSQTPQSNGRFRNLVNESEEHVPDTTTEYDSVSNNDSCSVESEDHQKDKNNSNATNASSRTDPNPISNAEKREKIRLKNEKKHQRQRERRAQELHEKCCNYITSRKLESLAQTLVSMGFTSEAATMALIHNKGRVEESAVWILEGGMESKKNSTSNLDEANVKIDIKDELSKIVEFESKFKCSKLEVEKAVVACEGDLQKTVELLKVQLKQQESVATISQNLDENGSNEFQHNNNNSNNNKPPLNSSNVKAPPVKLLSYSLNSSNTKYSWKLDEVTKEECKLEIDRSDKNEQGKKIVKFGFATKDTDKLLSHVVDGYEVKYMLRTDAIRLRLEFEIPVPYCNGACGEVTLELKQRGGRRTTINLLHDQRPIKKPKLDHNSDDPLKLSFTRNVPLNLLTCMYVVVRLKDSSGTLFVDRRCAIFPFTVPVDQEEYIYFKNGYIKLKVYWGCSFRDGNGFCTGVCTCEPAEFVGFHSPSEVSCTKNNEE